MIKLSCIYAVLTDDCPVFHGPLPSVCLEKMWIDVGCDGHGAVAPASLTELQRLEIWKGYNI